VLGREEPVGHVDGDALLALGGEAVDQEGEVELAALGADLLGVGLERREVVLEDELGVVEEPMRVDLPSSTLPQVMKRSIDLCSCWSR
jgi:hypothetical protein